MWKYAAVVLVCVLTLGACGNLDSSKTSGDAAQDRKIQIGMSFDSFVIERWQTDRDIFVSTAKELGAEVNVQNANGDLEQQKKQINYFIDKGMDVIVIICIDSEGLAEQVQKAKEAGIKVIAYDRMIMDSDIDLYITFDNERVGTMMGEALVDNGLSGGKVLMLGGSAVDSNVAMGGNVPEDTICRMEEVLEKMKKLDEEQFDQVFVYDNQMHGLLVEMTGMTRLYKAWKELNYGNIVTGFSLSTDKKRVLERQYPIHKELVDACREKNKEKICHVLSEHYMRTIRRLLKEQGLSEEDSGFSFDFLV